MPEAFKPIAVRPPATHPLLFAVRCFFDLQLLTIFRFLRPQLRACRGRVLDVGAGESPWRDLLIGAEYVGLDVEAADAFGMRRKPDIVYYDGISIPFQDGSFDHVLCVEVLEHVPDPERFLAELLRVLRKGGTLILTVPWSARVHHVPHDYGRFTRFGLAGLVGKAGFAGVRIEERGHDIAVLANKLLVVTVRLLRPARTFHVMWSWPVALLVGPVATGFILASHVASALSMGSRDDPLGYALVASRP